MCGISGYISDNTFLENNSIKNTLSLMKRRGPDSQDFFQKNYQNKDVALLHSRLNIIDLNSQSNQPFYDKDLILVFNGEIYNYLELRKDLEKKNYIFNTNSDTEVLLKTFQEYGEKCVEHFIGMWSFAIWDLKKKKLFLSRDPFGEKPLYYTISHNNFFFGSEIKFIKSLCKKKFEINKDKIYENIFFGYKSLNKDDKTFYKDIFTIESGTNITIDLDLNISKKKYWEPQVHINKNMNAQEAAEGTNHYLTNSLKLRMRSDVPIAFCLSGGVDSGILVSHAKKTFEKNISTFSIIDKDHRYNESYNIECVVKDLNCSSNLINIENKQNNFFNRLNDLTNYHDGPIATLSYYVHSYLSESISQNNYKVAISGTGADEIFTGYYDHYLLHFEAINNTKYLENSINSWKKDILPNIRNPYLKNPFLYIEDPKNRELVYEKNFDLLNYSISKKKKQFIEKKYSSELLRNRMMNELINEVVPVILKHDDLNSMYYSIENRSPYLDRDLIKFALTIPPHLLISDGYQKKVLRDSAKGVLLDKVRLSKQKKGFNASINSVVDLKNKDVLDFIFNEKSSITEFIDLKKMKNEIQLDKIPNHLSKLIFTIISTKLFLGEKWTK
jgi:asparagine synthase (glutamine-hydrolysing)